MTEHVPQRPEATKHSQTTPDHPRQRQTTPDHARPRQTTPDRTGRSQRIKTTLGEKTAHVRITFQVEFLMKSLSSLTLKQLGASTRTTQETSTNPSRFLPKLPPKYLQNLIKMTSGTPSGPTPSKISLFAHFGERPGEPLGSLWGAFWVTFSNFWASVFRTIFKGVLGICFPRFLTDLGMLFGSLLEPNSEGGDNRRFELGLEPQPC